MANNGGDQLARGAKSATFGPPANISQARWDAIWADEKAADAIKITRQLSEPESDDPEQ